MIHSVPGKCHVPNRKEHMYNVSDHSCSTRHDGNCNEMRKKRYCETDPYDRPVSLLKHNSLVCPVFHNYVYK